MILCNTEHTASRRQWVAKIIATMTSWTEVGPVFNCETRAKLTLAARAASDHEQLKREPKADWDV